MVENISIALDNSAVQTFLDTVVKLIVIHAFFFLKKKKRAFLFKFFLLSFLRLQGCRVTWCLKKLAVASKRLDMNW